MAAPSSKEKQEKQKKFLDRLAHSTCSGILLDPEDLIRGLFTSNLSTTTMKALPAKKKTVQKSRGNTSQTDQSGNYFS